MHSHLGTNYSRKIWIVIGIVMLALHSLPMLAPSLLHILIMMLLFAVMGQGWNILGGYAGQFSFGHTIFFGLGAYTSTLLFLKLGVSPWIGMMLSVFIAIAVGLFIGALSFRYGLKGPFFALIMLACAEIFFLVTQGVEWTGGSQGLLIPLQGNSVIAMQFMTKTIFYYIALWMTAASLYIVFRIENTRLGYYFMAVREDHEAAEALGVNCYRVQLMAMAFSAGMTAICGTVYAQYLLYIDPDSVFGMLNSVEIMIRPIIGGAGTIFGPLLGSAVLTPLAEFSRIAFQSYSGVYLMWYGMILIIAIIFIPNGLVGLIKSISKKYHRKERVVDEH
jgi:branched-chain amino acid transport system permease protein